MNRNATLIIVFFFFIGLIYAQFPNPASLSTGQGTPGNQDPIWQCSPWSSTMPGNPMGETYGPTLINNNCAPGAWVDPASLPAPMNNGNWITGTESNCAVNTMAGFRYFRLTLNLPPDCNGNSVTVQGSYVLSLIGYVDNYIHNVFINGNSQGISGGGFSPGSQLSIYLDGPWQVGTNYVDILIQNTPSSPPGGENPYGLLLVADGTDSANMDSDGDGVNDLDDLCPCDYGTNIYGCPDPVANTCDIDLIRSTFLNAGCIELPLCYGDCSMYFLNPNPSSGSVAQAFAQTYGANLISIQDAQENECVINELNRIGETGVIWIGFNDEEEEGNFVWYDQAPVTYTNWAPGEPNNTAGNENCTQIYPDGLWNDLNCNTANAKSIIEVNLCPVVVTDDITICENETAIIAASNPILGSHPYSFSWDNGATTQTQTVPSVDETYIITVVDRYNCSGKDTMEVVAKPVPSVDPADTLICSGESTNFQIISNLQGTTFDWIANPVDVNGASNGNGSSIVQVLTTPGNTNGSVIYTVTPENDGCPGDPADLTVTVSALPALTFAPASASVCIGDSISLNVSGADTYVWSPATALNTTAGSDVISFPASNQVYTVVGTNADGCESSGTVNLTANPKPSPVISGDTEYCEGTTAAIQTTQAYSSYLWSNGQTTQSIQVTEADSQVTVTVTDANGCSQTSAEFTVTEKEVVVIDSTITICADESVIIHGVERTVAATYSVTLQSVNGCDSTSNITLVVNPLPVINAGIDQSICQDSSVVLNAVGAPSIVWTNSITNGVPFVPASTAAYIATGTDANGCVGTDTVVVTVNIPVNVNAGADREICLGDSVVLSASPSNLGAVFTWTGGVTDGVAFYPSQTGQYIVTSVDPNGCTSTDEVEVVVNPLPVIEAGQAVFGCENDLVTLTASGAGPNGGYVWNNGVVNGVPFTPPVGTTAYFVTGTDANGCEGEDSVSINIQEYPVISFYAVQDAYCTPVIGTFYNTTPGGQNCIWTFDNGASLNDCGTVIQEFDQDGVFGASLQVESSNGCISMLYQDSLVVIDPYPEASFIYSPEDVASYEPEVQFTNTSSGAVSYIWDFGDDSADSYGISPVHVYALDEAGSYLVTLIAISELGCRDTATTIIKVEEELIFYVPNAFTPDGNQFNQTFEPVFTSGYDPFDYTLLIFNRWGEIIFESHDVTVGWNGMYGGVMCETGTYTWTIEVKTLKSDERKFFSGHVSLLK